VRREMCTTSKGFLGTTSPNLHRPTWGANCRGSEVQFIDLGGGKFE